MFEKAKEIVYSLFSKLKEVHPIVLLLLFCTSGLSLYLVNVYRQHMEYRTYNNVPVYLAATDINNSYVRHDASKLPLFFANVTVKDKDRLDTGTENVLLILSVSSQSMFGGIVNLDIGANGLINTIPSYKLFCDGRELSSVVDVSVSKLLLSPSVVREIGATMMLYESVTDNQNIIQRVKNGKLLGVPQSYLNDKEPCPQCGIIGKPKVAVVVDSEKLAGIPSNQEVIVNAKFICLGCHIMLGSGDVLVFLDGLESERAMIHVIDVIENRTPMLRTVDMSFDYTGVSISWLSSVMEDIVVYRRWYEDMVEITAFLPALDIAFMKYKEIMEEQFVSIGANEDQMWMAFVDFLSDFNISYR